MIFYRLQEKRKKILTHSKNVLSVRERFTQTKSNRRCDTETNKKSFYLLINLDLMESERFMETHVRRYDAEIA